MAVAQTSMLAASIGLLIYIAVITTTSLVATQGSTNHPFTTQSDLDSAMREEMLVATDYIHSSDTSKASQTVLLNGITLAPGEFILLFDSTPYANRGHIALNVPCDESNPRLVLVDVLVGRAPMIAPLKLGYVEQISDPPDMCVYHSQFGFGDPVTDIVLQNISGNEISFRDPHSVTLSIHEHFRPTEKSPKEIQHVRLGQQP